MPLIQLDLQLACADTTGLPPLAAFRRWVAASLTPQHKQAEVTLRLVDEAESQGLNERYRGKPYPTNVLAFPADTPIVLTPPLLGDLVICRQVVEREARAQQKPLLAHWAHMVVHGSLHLLGYDHDTETTATAMESLEILILQTLGYANPYCCEPTPRSPS